MTFQLIFFICLCQILAVNPGLTTYNNKNDITISDNKFLCDRNYNLTWMEFVCSNELLLDNIEIDDLDPIILESIEVLNIKGMYDNKGPLITIPSNICRFIRLKNLSLSSNKIQNLDFNYTTSCLSELRTLHLSNNLITNISVKWFHQMPLLEHVYLSSNNLTDLPYDIFNNVSHLRILNVARNYLSTIELWTSQVRDQVDYQLNRINGFSNKYNVDLSHLQTQKLPTFYINRDPEIQFDDTIFEMYNRCAEVHNIPNFFTTYIPTLTLAVLTIIKSTNYARPFYKNCSCDQYYFYRTAFAIEGYPNNNSAQNWICPGHSVSFIQQCNNRSSANFTSVIPRLCKIDDSEPGNVPVYAPEHRPNQTTETSTVTTQSITITTQQTTTTTTTTTMILTTTTSNFPANPDEIEKYLDSMTVLDNSTVENFIRIINNVNTRQNITSNSNISEETKLIYRKIIRHIENLIESVNSTLNNTDAAVALVSTTKINPVYHLNQFSLPNSSIIYSSESDYNHSVASISINQNDINQLAHDTFYSFFFLPSSLFQYAQVDSHVEIVSPIVGAYLPIEQLLNVQISFHDYNLHPSSGNYSCVFWQVDQWNHTGCHYSYHLTTNRHYCHCNHLTSFALIFTPNGILRQTFLPTIITSCFSIIGLCISIILSVYQQTKPQSIRRSRRFSITNIFSLSSTLILFILFITFLVINYQSSTIQSTTITPCQSSKLNLVLATYFFIMLTFITKTFVGIYYYFTTFVHFKFHLFSDQSEKWYLTLLLMVILIALIPSIVASTLSHHWNNVIVSKNDICWFHGIYLINFVTIPVSIFLGINMIIVILISIRLFQFLCNVNVDQAKAKRLVIATCMWIASCVLLGILWIVGPLLGLFVNENGESSSMSSQIMQWIFALLAGLEGVWVLIVNILFYVRQRPKTKVRWAYSPEDKKKCYRIDDVGRVSVDMHDNQKQTSASS